MGGFVFSGEHVAALAVGGWVSVGECVCLCEVASSHLVSAGLGREA